MKLKKVTQTALLLALILISQIFKNLSPFITGPIINAILIIATLTIGLYSGIILSVIAPITSFFIAQSPIMQGIPLILPVIIVGNIIIVLAAYVFDHRFTFRLKLPIGLVLGSIMKSLFMGVIIVYILIPMFSSNIRVPVEKLPAVIKVAETTFSISQLFTGLIGSVIALIVIVPLRKFLKHEQSA